MKKAAKVNGLRNRYQSQGSAALRARRCVCVESEPVSIAMVSSATDAGSS